MSGEISDILFKTLYQSIVVRNNPVAGALAEFDAAATRVLNG